MRSWPVLIALSVACAKPAGPAIAPSLAPSASVGRAGAVLALSVADSLWRPVTGDTASRGPPVWVWTVGWGDVHSMDLAAFNLVIVIRRPIAHPVATRRLVEAAKVEYDHLYQAGSIVAIGLDTVPNARVRLEGGRLVIRWGPSRGLDRLLADRPDSLRVSLRGWPERGYAGYWFRPRYQP
jgi:hypothetical protein